jgi:phage gp16-like protein
MKRAADPRRQQLARIHAAKKAAGLDDDTYRALLERVTGLRSSADMTTAQRNAVLEEFARLRMRGEQQDARVDVYAGRPDAALMKSRPMLRKVAALLTDSKRPWSYAHAMAQRMHQVDKVEWLNDHQLHALVSALQIDTNRRQKPATTTRTTTRRKTPPC